MPEIFDSQDKNSVAQPSSNQDEQAIDSPPKSTTSKEDTINSAIEQKSNKQQRQTDHKPKNKVDNYSQTLRKEKPAKNPLKAFAPKPEKVKFDSQMEEEEVVLLLRSHPSTLIRPVLLILVCSVLPILIFNSSFLGVIAGRFKIAGLILWYMLTFSFALETFLVWFFSVYIVTDERIIDVDFSSLIYKNVSSAKIENIEDITVATSGVLASVIDFGTVYIQTAAEVPEIEFDHVPQPSTVAKALNELLLEEEREKIEGRVI